MKNERENMSTQTTDIFLAPIEKPGGSRRRTHSARVLPKPGIENVLCFFALNAQFTACITKRTAQLRQFLTAL